MFRTLLQTVDCLRNWFIFAFQKMPRMLYLFGIKRGCVLWPMTFSFSRLREPCVSLPADSFPTTKTKRESVYSRHLFSFRAWTQPRPRQMTHTWQIKTDFVISILITHWQSNKPASRHNKTNTCNELFVLADGALKIPAQCHKNNHSGGNDTVAHGSGWSRTDFKGLIKFHPSLHQRESACHSVS